MMRMDSSAHTGWTFNIFLLELCRSYVIVVRNYLDLEKDQLVGNNLRYFLQRNGEIK